MKSLFLWKNVDFSSVFAPRGRKQPPDVFSNFGIMTIIALAPTRPKVAALKLEETAKYCNFCLVSGIPRAWFFSMEQLVIWSETSVINNKLDRFVN